MNQRNANYHTYKSKLDRGLNNLYLIFTLVNITDGQAHPIR